MASSTPAMPITHVLLDIEGTTCPVSFVAEVLFPMPAPSSAATYKPMPMSQRSRT